MKKALKSILIIVAILSSFLIIQAAELPLRVVLDQTTLTFPDAQPFIDANGRTQTPSRFIGESLGATVEWDAVTQKATFTKGETVLIITIGKTSYTLDGIQKTMDTKAIIKDSRTFVPARYISEAYTASGTEGSVDNYKYREYIKDGQHIYKITEQTTVTIEINKINRKVYTHLQMADDQYTVSAWLADINLGATTNAYKTLGTLRGIVPLDQITVTVKGSMLEDSN